MWETVNEIKCDGLCSIGLEIARAARWWDWMATVRNVIVLPYHFHPFNGFTILNKFQLICTFEWRIHFGWMLNNNYHIFIMTCHQIIQHIFMKTIPIRVCYWFLFVGLMKIERASMHITLSRRLQLKMWKFTDYHFY